MLSQQVWSKQARLLADLFSNGRATGRMRIHLLLSASAYLTDLPRFQTPSRHIRLGPLSSTGSMRYVRIHRELGA